MRLSPGEVNAGNTGLFLIDQICHKFSGITSIHTAAREAVPEATVGLYHQAAGEIDGS
jgi:hypothetical protein